MWMEDHILLAAFSLSEGANLESVMDCLNSSIKASQGALTDDPEAMHWFNLGIPTYLLRFQGDQTRVSK